MSLIRRFASLLRRRLNQDLEDELRAHLEMREQGNMAEGMTE
jgi:hypothetical protein